MTLWSFVMAVSVTTTNYGKTKNIVLFRFTTQYQFITISINPKLVNNPDDT